MGTTLANKCEPSKHQMVEMRGAILHSGTALGPIALNSNTLAQACRPPTELFRSMPIPATSNAASPGGNPNGSCLVVTGNVITGGREKIPVAKVLCRMVDAASLHHIQNTLCFFSRNAKAR